MIDKTGELSQSEAQQRAEQIQSFKQELSCIQSDSEFLLSNEQQQQIKDYHTNKLAELKQRFDIDLTTRAKQLSWGMKIASLFAALAMTSSLFFLFYHFWGYFNTPLQVSVLVAAPIVSFVVTVWLAGREQASYFSKIAALVSYGCFILNLSMLGQIFNIAPSPNAVLVWSAYAAFLAYMCRARLLLFFAIVGVLNFIAMKFGTWFGIYWISFGERPENFFIPALVMFLLPLKISRPKYHDFDPIYRVLALIALFVPILILSHYGRISYLSWSVNNVEGFYQVIGFVLAAIVIWVSVKFQWRDSVNTGMVFFILFLYTKFFDWWWEFLPKYLFFFAIGAISFGVLIIFKRLRNYWIQKEQLL